MNTKEALLFVLEEQRGMYVSGEELAKRLGVSRTAVWKAVNSLREDGFDIASAGSRGYRLSAESDLLSSAAVQQALKTRVFDVRVVPETGSTNDDVKALAERGAPEFTVVASELQTKGKGRLGRSFYSPQRTGIYFSVLLRPKLPVTDALFITTSAAVATASAIEEVCGRQAGIKWVNDIYWQDRKVCGILTEASLDLENGSLAYAVLGIGINVSPPEGGFPEELKTIAGCLYPEGGCPAGTRSRLLASLLDKFYELYIHLPEKRFLDEYRRRSILKGLNVNVIQGDRTYPASVVGIDDQCHLLVSRDGQLIALDSGEVSVRPIK